MSGAVKLTKNTDPDKYFYSGYGIGFDSRSLFSYLGFNWHKIVVIFGVANSWSVHNYNKKGLLVLGEGPTQELGDKTTIAKAKYYINFSRLGKNFCLSQQYNGRNRFFIC